MEAPIYVYYELDNFYQNHRRYVKSVAAAQLSGSFGASTKDCDPLYKSASGKNLFPCGLIANSMFNGTCTACSRARPVARGAVSTVRPVPAQTRLCCPLVASP